MSKTGGGFGIGSIIFMVIVYNLIFDDDEKEVKIIDKAKEVISDTTEKIKESETAQKIISAAKEKLKALGTPEEKEEMIVEEEPVEESVEEVKKPPAIIYSDPEDLQEDEQPKTDEFEKL